MSEILRSPNGNGLLLTPRSGSHSICVAALEYFWPEIEIKDEGHPAWYLPFNERWDGANTNIGIIVRNPIERFRSMVAHKSNLTLEEHLNNPAYPPLPKGNFAQYFIFEDQLQECAYWLGIESILDKIDATEDESKPVLTPEQETIVRDIYIDDMILWEKLQNKEKI